MFRPWKIQLSLFALLLCSGLCSFFPSQATAHNALSHRTTLLVRFRVGATPSPLWMQRYHIHASRTLLTPAFSQKHTIQRKPFKRLQRTYVMTVPRARVDEITEQLQHDSRVAEVSPDVVFHTSTYPLDTHFDLQWSLHNDGSIGTEDTDIDAPEGWTLLHNSSVPIAVIDTGIDDTHEDLSANIWTNPDETPGDDIDNDHNGYVDDVHGWDFVNNDNDPTDDNGHGTHVAGSIGAVGNNNKGISGVVWNAELIPLKAIDEDGDTRVSDILEALQYADTMEIPISNNSYNSATGFSSQPFKDILTTLDDDNHLFIASSGNEGTDNDIDPEYPASFENDNIVSVTSTTYNDTLSSFANTGKTSVDLAAPGDAIYSTVPTGSCDLCKPSGYDYASGTSMATAEVSGVAALMWAHNSSLSNRQIKTALMESGDALSELSSTTVSGKRLNAYAALRFVENTPPVAGFTASTNSILQDSPIQFNGSTSSDADNDRLTYAWDFGDGTTASTVKPSHAFKNIGSYTVILTVSDGGWTSTAQKKVSITAKPFFITNFRFIAKKLRWEATDGLHAFHVRLRFRGKHKVKTLITWNRKAHHGIRAKKIRDFLIANPQYQKRKKLRVRVIGTTTNHTIKKSSPIKIPKKRYRKWKKRF